MKRTGYFQVVIVLMVVSFIASGCAVKEVNLPPGQLAELASDHKMVITASLKDNELEVLDHTEVKDNGVMLYNTAMFGVGGALGTAAGQAIAAKVVKSRSVDGDLDLLRDELKANPVYPVVKEKVEDDLARRLSKEFDVEVLRGIDIDVERPGREPDVEDYVPYAKELGADLILKVDLSYGLAAYQSESSSAAVDAAVSVYDINAGRVVMKRSVTSDSYFKESRTVEEFSANDAETFRADILSAADGLSLRIASEFDADLDEAARVKTGFDGVVSSMSMTCKSPYLLQQDCSALSGPKRKIVLDGHKAKIAGSDNGRVVVILHIQQVFEPQEKENNDSGEIDPFADPFEGTNRMHTKELNKSGLEAVKARLEQNGLEILQLFRVAAPARDIGFILVLNGDGYSVLKGYSKDGLAKRHASTR